MTLALAKELAPHVTVNMVPARDDRPAPRDDPGRACRRDRRDALAQGSAPG